MNETNLLAKGVKVNEKIKKRENRINIFFPFLFSFRLRIGGLLSHGRILWILILRAQQS